MEMGIEAAVMEEHFVGEVEMERWRRQGNVEPIMERMEIEGGKEGDGEGR